MDLPRRQRHISISFSRRKPLFTSASKSSVFALDFFHSLFGFGRGGEVGGVDPWADPVASSRDLFFSVPVFMLFDGEHFILQVQWVSLASARGLLWGKQWRRVWIYSLGHSGSALGWLTLG
jgi:hypothetical protein